jgi:hypothetical protein
MAAAASGLYVIDTCSITELRRTYPQKGFPPVWALLDDLAIRQKLISVEDVAIELDAFDDESSEWARAHESIFLPLSAEIQAEARKILAVHPNLVDIKKRKSSADPFVVALAVVRGGTVVTQEKPSGGPHKVKIPDVCASLGVLCIPLLDMLLAEGLGE